MSTPLSFEDYCADHNIQLHEYGQAFAAYLHELSGGEWDGRGARQQLMARRGRRWLPPTPSSGTASPPP